MNTVIFVSWSPTSVAGRIITPPALITPSRIFAVGEHSLATHGTSDCYGEYNTTTQTGWGPAYQNACIHSGETEHSGGSTVWYNYTLASAGTIIDESTTQQNLATNTNTAAESICPKGWTLPSKIQIDSQRNISSFSPVQGGHYGNGTLYSEGTHGRWWGSTAYNGARRYYLNYDGSSLYTYYGGGRYYGFYIRCVSEEKTVTDLTYMQKHDACEVYRI